MMDKLWIVFVVIYSLLKGSRDGMKKAALKKSSSNEILFFYTLLGFVFVIPFSTDAFKVAPIFIFYSFIKAAVVSAAWLFALKALKKMTVSLYGIMDLSRVVFSTALGVFALGEAFTVKKAIGIALVIAGLLLVNLKKNAQGGKGMTLPILIAALLNCFLNAVSGTMDKVLMQYMTSSQLQFWFMLFSALIYGGILLVTHEKVSVKSVKTNYWIPLLSLSLVFGDRLLFEANASPLSQVTLMTIIKQSSVVVTVLTGWLIYKEKDILYKLMCTGIVLSGIFVALI